MFAVLFSGKSNCCQFVIQQAAAVVRLLGDCDSLILFDSKMGSKTFGQLPCTPIGQQSTPSVACNIEIWKEISSLSRANIPVKTDAQVVTVTQSSNI